ncbi:MAG TPA: ABC transporter ATP-binding protein [Acidimicrobiales bacterium]|jgi:ATP-binding cassette subfamily B protein
MSVIDRGGHDEHEHTRDDDEDRPVSGWRLAWRLSRYLRVQYYFGGALWVVVIAFPVLTGLVLKALFDRFSEGAAADVSQIAWLLVLFVVLDVIRQAFMWLAIATWPYWWNAVQTLMRANVLRSILCAPGPAAGRLPASSAEALNRFRDDVEDILLLTDIWIDVTGDAVFAAFALTIMFSIDARVTLVIVLPLLAIIAGTRVLSDRIKAAHSAARAAAADVSEQIGGLFSGVLTLKAAGAEDAAIARLREHNAIRRVLEIRARLLTDLLDTLTASSVELSTGLVLLLVAPKMKSGEFTVGDLALFTAYVGWLAGLPRRVGRMLYRQRQASVAGTRLLRLLTAQEDDRTLVEHRPVYFRGAAPSATPPPPLDEPFTRLEVEDLTAHHPSSGRGIEHIDLVVDRGELVVVTGAIGSGKTTLIRALLGLVPREGGTIRWNGRAVDDPGHFLVPPRTAYAAQVPRLWSASLHENLLLGWNATDVDVMHALQLARLDDDVAGMTEGLDTIVGPRGMRLSGGQLQRALAARALVRRPELLVVDDLSSALDVETEQALWEGLAARSVRGAPPAALLVVSHRPAVLARATRVVTLEEGRVSGDPRRSTGIPA